MPSEKERRRNPRRLRGTLGRNEKPIPKNRETVTEFLARGGVIRKVQAPWDRTPEPLKKRSNKDWGSFGTSSVA